MIWFTVLTSMNGQNNTYNYYYLDAKNGNINNKKHNVSDTVLLWEAANYYAKMDQIVALKVNRTTKCIEMYLLDAVSLNVLRVFQQNLINGYEICKIEMMSTLDEKNGIIWIMVYSLNKGYCGDGYLVGLYVNNGTLVQHNPPLVCTTGIGVLCPEAFQWTSE
eukprot:UN10965